MHQKHYVPVPEPSPPQYHNVPVPVKVTDPGKVREKFFSIDTALYYIYSEYSTWVPERRTSHGVWVVQGSVRLERQRNCLEILILKFGLRKVLKLKDPLKRRRDMDSGGHLMLMSWHPSLLSLNSYCLEVIHVPVPLPPQTVVKNKVGTLPVGTC